MARLIASPFPLADRRSGSRPSPLRGVAWIVGLAAWTAAALVGAVLALALAAGLVVVAAMSSLVLGLAATGVRARRAFGRRADGTLLEARRVGGHSWVAYGWDRDLHL